MQAPRLLRQEQEQEEQPMLMPMPKSTSTQQQQPSWLPEIVWGGSQMSKEAKRSLAVALLSQTVWAALWSMWLRWKQR